MINTQKAWEELTDEYHFVFSQHWTEESEICPTCGQTLPAERITQMQSDFNLRRSKRLEEINQKGKKEASKDMIAACDERIAALEATVSEEESARAAADMRGTELEAQLVPALPYETTTEYTSLNRQSIFGADVMTRMESALSGKAEDMKRIIESDILDLIEGLGVRSHFNVNDIVLSGNTVMYHLLMESDVSGLSRYPFTPVSLGGEEFKRDDVFVYETEKRNILSPECSIRLVKGFSAFVGGDIASGLLACDIPNRGENVFFIDIGTNAEMVLKKDDTLYTASAAAGPALEGGNLKCGTGSVPGAICGVEIMCQTPVDTFGLPPV